MSPRSQLEQTKAIQQDTTTKKLKDEPEKKQCVQIVWLNVIIQSLIHMGAVYGIYCCFYAKYQTLITAYLFHLFGGLGITAGAHRLWAHRSYKAELPLRIILGVFQTIAAQNSIYDWCRDHRVHHKHAETDGDPHNAKRGFFFSHMGWLMMKKHPDVISKGRKIPLDDLRNDIVVDFQHKFYVPMTIFCNFILPAILPYFLWNESLVIGYFVPGVLRYIVTLHVTWSVNSFAHMFGNKPYDTNINPAENLLVSMASIGEGFHNYHHTFPQDYATSEFGGFYFNFTKIFIDSFYAIGQVTDRKKISPELVMARRKRTGDLSESLCNEAQNIEHNY